MRRDHGIDADVVAVTGGSAGGHLTALATLTAGSRSWQPGVESQVERAEDVHDP
jgi:acetyl esterase/lipase